MIHTIPKDLEKSIHLSTVTEKAWEDISPLARNEWICWIESAKKSETRAVRIDRAFQNLKAGKRRPCCWAGCTHRTKR